MNDVQIFNINLIYLLLLLWLNNTFFKNHVNNIDLDMLKSKNYENILIIII